VKVGGARCDGLISVRQLHAKVERLPGRFAVSPQLPPSKKATHSTQVYFCGVILADWTRTSLGYHGWGAHQRRGGNRVPPHATSACTPAPHGILRVIANTSTLLEGRTATFQ
jgi:hypothetical protein